MDPPSKPGARSHVMGCSAQEGASPACALHLDIVFPGGSLFPPILFMSPCFSASLLFFVFLFFFRPPLLPLMAHHGSTFRSFALLHLLPPLPPPPLTPGRGLLYGVCPQSAHSVVCLLLAGQSNPAAHARLPGQQKPSARLRTDGMGPRLRFKGS